MTAALFDQLGCHLLAGETEQLAAGIKEALAAGTSPQQVLDGALMPAMETLGVRFSEGEAFLPELLLAADTMQRGALEILRPVLVAGDIRPHATVLLGTVMGDIHDLGKTLVKMMLEGAGFRVNDLGTSVPVERFVAALDEEPAEIVAMSSLLSSTMGEMKKVMAAVRSQHPATRFMVGGAPVTQAFADEIGADGYAPDAYAAVQTARGLVGSAAAERG